MFRNYDPSLRPQEKAMEYVRALNAVKLDKVIFPPLFCGFIVNRFYLLCSLSVDLIILFYFGFRFLPDRL